MNHPRTLGPIARRLALWGLVALALLTPTPASAGPEGQLTWGVHLSLVTRWLDPAEMEGILTPFLFYYALHDALVKPMPGHAMGPSLAESWTMGKDAQSYDFVLRKGVRFHNGDPVTAEDVKFTFERYKGAGGKLLREKVREVQVVDPGRVRFHLREPWPDFMTFYGTSATGAGWIVPKKYVDRVGDDGFKKAPVGAGPYRFVSFKPGVELVLEAFEGYWRKVPSVKTLVFRVIPDESTRLAALKRGEVDIAYSITGPLAEELKRTPGLTLAPTFFPFTIWLVFTEQWDTKSPWHDKRVRLATNYAIDRQGINQAVYLGYSKLAYSFVPQGMEYYWGPPPYPYDPKRAKQLLAEAGYPNRFDAGDLSAEAIYGAAIGEPVVNYLQAAGIRFKLRLLERAAFFGELAGEKLPLVG